MNGAIVWGERALVGSGPGVDRIRAGGHSQGQPHGSPRDKVARVQGGQGQESDGWAQDEAQAQRWNELSKRLVSCIGAGHSCLEHRWTTGCVAYGTLSGHAGLADLWLSSSFLFLPGACLEVSWDHINRTLSGRAGAQREAHREPG